MNLEEWFSSRYILDGHWHSRLLEYKERLNIPPEIFDDILRIIRLGVLYKLRNGRSREILILASIYSAYKIHRKIIVVEELIGEKRISKKSFRNMHRSIENKILPKLNLEIYHYSYVDYLEERRLIFKNNVIVF